MGGLGARDSCARSDEMDASYRDYGAPRRVPGDTRAEVHFCFLRKRYNSELHSFNI